MPLVHLHQVFPNYVPGARTLEFAIGFPDEPLRVLLPLGAAPAGVIDHQIEHEPTAPGMDRGGQFQELIDAGGPPIELDQGWVDLGEVLEGVRRAVASEPREGRRCRADREQVQNAAAESVDDVRQFRDERSQGSAGRDHGEPFLVQRLEDRGVVVLGGGDTVLRPGTEHPGKCAIHRVRGARPRGVDADADVGPVGPMLEALGVDRVSLGLEIAHLGQGQGDRPLAVGGGAQWQVAPCGPGQGEFLEVGLEDLLTDPLGPAQVGAQTGLPTGADLSIVGLEREGQRIAGVSDDTGPGQRRHGKSSHGFGWPAHGTCSAEPAG